MLGFASTAMEILALAMAMFSLAVGRDLLAPLVTGFIVLTGGVLLMWCGILASELQRDAGKVEAASKETRTAAPS
jgi:hypothetical protein